MIRKLVIATVQYEGTHSWKDCPHEEVSFLRNEHRHMFHIKAWKLVSHNNREIEIIILKRQISSFLSGYNHQFGSMSCEDIAEILINNLDLDACEVIEDGENGAYLERV